MKLGSSLLMLTAYWYLVAHTGQWYLGVTAFAVACALNALHLYLDREVSGKP